MGEGNGTAALYLYTCNKCGAAVVDDQRAAVVDDQRAAVVDDQRPVSKGDPDPDGIRRHNRACWELGGPRGSYDMKGYTFVVQLLPPIPEGEDQ